MFGIIFLRLTLGVLLTCISTESRLWILVSVEIFQNVQYVRCYRSSSPLPVYQCAAVLHCLLVDFSGNALVRLLPLFSEFVLE